jgi:outer membrane murein-binding lipoprotein Lpp
MSDQFEEEREYQAEAAPDIGPLRSDRRMPIVIYIMLALIGSGAAFLWHTYDGVTDALPIFKSEPPPQAPDTVSLKSFDEYQQAVAGNLRHFSEMLQTQDVEIKRLTDQVLQLNTKIDSLESHVRDAQAAIPPAPKQAPRKPAAKPRIPTEAPVPAVQDEKE